MGKRRGKPKPLRLVWPSLAEKVKPLEKRELTPEFLAALKRLWDERGDELLRRVADKNPELVLALVASVKAKEIK